MFHVRDRAFNDLRYHIDTSELFALGWQPQVGFNEGMKRTADWSERRETHNKIRNQTKERKNT